MGNWFDRFKPAVGYLTMGAGLVLSSVRYLRVFLQGWQAPPPEDPPT